jgi:hypothetical protein
MDKQVAINTYNGILFSDKKGMKYWYMLYNVDEPRKHYGKWKESDEKVAYFLIPLYKIFKIGKFIETGWRLIVARGWRKGRIGSSSLMGRDSPFGVMKMLWK